MDLSELSEFHPLNFSKNVNEIKKTVVCRDQEINDILSFLGQTPMDEPAPAIFVHGDTGTGKSLLIKNCLKRGKFRHAIVNCIEGYSMKLIYESIINQLAHHIMDIDNSFQPYGKCFTFYDFVDELQKLSDKFDIGKQNGKSFSIIIVSNANIKDWEYGIPCQLSGNLILHKKLMKVCVLSTRALDKAEELRKLDRNVLASFLKLREITNLKISVIFLSILPWSNFYSSDNALQPIMFYLSHYTQKQVQEILELDKPEQFTSKFYSNYINLFLSVFYQACHDMRELKYQASIIFEKYSEPIRNEELTENDVSELWKRSQPFFKKSLKSLYLKMDNEMEDMEKLTSVTGQALNMELPYYSKYLLIGSYIASYNPPKEDKKLFLKNHGKIRKPRAVSQASQSVKYHLVGPKPFGLQRLLAIVSSILDDDKFDFNADLHIEIATLVKMNLLTQISDDILDGPTFKCNVGLQFIESISKNVQFPIRKYLVDFMD